MELSSITGRSAELPGVSVVVPTYNRAAGVARLLDSLTALDTRGVTCEIIVVDNGSHDDTRRMIERRAVRVDCPVRYLHEPRRGVSYARNTGLRAAAAPIVAFADDDEEVAPDWIQVVTRTFRACDDVVALGGRVHPRWLGAPPPRITPSVWGPLSIIDRGPVPFRVTRERWICLPGGNMAWRRRTLFELGGFSPDYPRSQDRELTVRALLAGCVAMYVPDMLVYHYIDGRRLTRAFFRQWHRTEGTMRAGYAFEELFTVDGHIRPLSERAPRALGVSRFVYRAWLRAARDWAASLARGDGDEAFRQELQWLYLSSYIHRRIELTAVPGVSVPHRAGALLARGLARAAALLGTIAP